MALQCLQGIRRAAGIEAAGRPVQRADQPAPEGDESDEEGPHRLTTLANSWARSARKSLALAVRALARAEMMRSTAGRSAWARRKPSRTRRRRRLRETELPTARAATDRPRRAWPSPFRATTAWKHPRPKRCPHL